MTHGSLFSGIGGFDLAAEWMGWENVFHCEWNEFGQKVLKHYWPKAISYHDITKTDFTIHRGRIDILTGGFPCQPYSMAGKRKGKEDERHLWPEMLRAIKEIQPRWVVGENVYGLVNWSGGLVFHEVQTDLETAGYEVFPYVLPAAAVNAPHRRDRVWFVAFNSKINRNSKIGGICKRTHNESVGICNKNINGTFTNPNGKMLEHGNGQRKTNNTTKSEKRIESFNSARSEQMGRDVADTGKQGLERQCRKRQGCSQHRSNKGLFIGAESQFNAANPNGIGLRGESNWFGESGFIGQNEPPTYWQNFPTQSPICTGDDGLSSRLDGITFSKWRNESIKAAGNAIVPQVALQIFKTIQQYEALPRMADKI